MLAALAGAPAMQLLLVSAGVPLPTVPVPVPSSGLTELLAKRRHRPTQAAQRRGSLLLSRIRVRSARQKRLSVTKLLTQTSRTNSHDENMKSSTHSTGPDLGIIVEST